MWGATREIKEATNGYEFRAYEIMHLIYLLVFKTTKVDESRVDKENVLNLIKMLDSVRVVLPHFFKNHSVGQHFRILIIYPEMPHQEAGEVLGVVCFLQRYSGISLVIFSALRLM